MGENEDTVLDGAFSLGDTPPLWSPASGRRTLTRPITRRQGIEEGVESVETMSVDVGGRDENEGCDVSPAAYAELHAASAFSFLRAGSAVEALVDRAAALGLVALALCDYMTLAGAVRFQAACVQRGVHGIIGVELAVADPIFGDHATPARLVALAENATGYARLCQLLTDANLAHPEAPFISWRTLAAAPEGLLLLTGGREGTLARLALSDRSRDAVEVARRYHAVFGRDHVFVEAQHQRLPDSVRLRDRLAAIAEEADLCVVATNGARCATQQDHPVYDLLTCVRLGVTVDQPHAERPKNDQAYLKGAAAMRKLFAGVPWGDAALSTSVEIAERCQLALLKGSCSAPRVALPPGETPSSYLQVLCEQGLTKRYADAPQALHPESRERRQLAHELGVIKQLELEEFFLCVHEIMTAARDLGLRVSARGSAANSLVAYLLSITRTDPIHYGLLFERFLNPERAGMPDIDIDVQSDRRDELIRYVERVYTEAHAAMVANVNTYRMRSAVRDAAKALGYPLALVDRLTKALPHHCDPEDLKGYEGELRQIIATVPKETPAEQMLHDRCQRRLERLLEIAPRLVGLPRHLSLHNGGMVLTREPLSSTLPVRVSANGVRALEVDKDDVERLGLIKFDLLGLRTLGAVEECVTLIDETMGTRPDVDHLVLDPPDERTMRLIRAGETLAVFQIESPGQWHLLAQTQPQTFTDLITQTALFRPGPIQGGFVHPYVERRKAKQPDLQRDAVQTPWKGAPTDDFWISHPILAPILADSEGILLFQEQILEIAHAFAGLSYAEADGFRRAMSHQRSHREMEEMRKRFVAGALQQGERLEDATRVFDAISHFVGYGFCKSHAAEFARTIYQTAWLKAHYPAHYLAAFLSAQPAGFFPPHVVLQEAKRLKIPVLGVDINRSEDRFTVERVGSPHYRRWAIRIGLAQVTQVGEELAQAILWARRAEHSVDGGEDEHHQRHSFSSLSDVCRRLRPVGLTWAAAEALTMAGAFDSLRPVMTRRQRLWQLHELWPLVSLSKQRRSKGSKGSKGSKRRGGIAPDADERPQQLAFSWELTLDPPPDLPALDQEERAAWEYRTMGLSAHPHPMRLLRRDLRRRGVRPIADLKQLPAGRVVRVAGWPISAQRPPTAKGMGFLVIEDETGRLPIAVPPQLAEQMYRRIRQARVVAVAGRVERIRWYRSMLALDLREISPHT
jgi:error-prone DNA polymerase